jgi:hypothetical protein
MAGVTGKTLLALFALAAALAPRSAWPQAASTSSGQAYPAKPVHIVVPFPAAIRSDTATWSRVIRETGIRAE